MKALLPTLALTLLAFVPQDGNDGKEGKLPAPEVGKPVPAFRLNDFERG